MGPLKFSILSKCDLFGWKGLVRVTFNSLFLNLKGPNVNVSLMSNVDVSLAAVDVLCSFLRLRSTSTAASDTSTLLKEHMFLYHMK